mmetsp:Transcript_96731/g.273271  ORF Transcript_96731/g.273271 Transcript_96731/m.273271 type:complete len:178 (+) Transcript_96731:75-608(+)
MSELWGGPAFAGSPRKPPGMASNYAKTKNVVYKSEHVRYNSFEVSPPQPGDHDYHVRSHATNFARGGTRCNKGKDWIRDPLSGAWFRQEWFETPGLSPKGQRLTYRPVTRFKEGYADRPSIGEGDLGVTTVRSLSRTFSAPGEMSMVASTGRSATAGASARSRRVPTLSQSADPWRG